MYVYHAIQIGMAIYIEIGNTLKKSNQEFKQRLKVIPSCLLCYVNMIYHRYSHHYQLKNKNNTFIMARSVTITKL